MPDNVDISKPFTVKFNRNDAKTVEVGIYNTSNKAFAQYVTVTGTSHTFDLTKKISPDDTRTPAERMYDDMPNTNSKQYLVYIATNSNTYRDSVARTFKIVGTHPSIPVFTQKDTNSYIVTKLTGNDQIFIQNYSDLQVDITTATPFRGSTIKKYIVINGSNTKTYTSSGVKNIGKVQAQQLQVIVQDSRGNRSQLIRQLDYIPYTQPIIQNFNLDREIGTSTSADLVTNGLYTAVDFGAVNNSITKVEYRSKTTGEYGSWTDITGLVLYGSGTFNNSTNTQLTGFTFGTAYTVELKVTDKLGFNTLTTTVSKGMFTMLIDQEYGSVGIGDMPKQEDNSLTVAGNVYANNVGVEILKDTDSNGTRVAYKYADGRLECTWKSTVIKTAVSTASGSLYSSSAISMPTYLVDFVEIPATTFGLEQNLSSSNKFFISPVALAPSLSKPSNVAITGVNNQAQHATAGYFINYISKGFWK